ncbi:hypothetical protein QJ850_gp925 [Acanthamoeba polyphaga mimivirus]|uniref:Uncharacterized protein n=1 Tax=Acanthamoeba polyphaga mimivirus Kroon TaxID=3069720 RepID=A0A0G2Y5D0_9VIRU|nr:hypothetical protein QJ850_gp925 [Acanthamoeba polyphaga mimivirus]AKI79774.1 hypothetical protein [Acanthamoeba polyphaga mimivirus Kroon]
MAKYYLIHAVVDSKPEKIMKILSDGYLFASSYSTQQGISGIPLDYVYFSLLGDFNVSMGGFKFILSTKILYKRSFRYALNWMGSNIQETVKVNYRYDNVDKILDKINMHIINGKYSSLPSIGILHEIILKKKVNLHRYLVAVSYGNYLTPEITNYLRTNYPSIKILIETPNSADKLSEILEK